MLTYKRNLTLDIYDYNGNKICPLYDSKSDVEGQAYDVYATTKRNGWKELNFSMPGNNFREEYLKPDFKIKAVDDDGTEWYLITAPKITHKGKQKTISVTAGHVSQLLKIKNLGLEFSDDEGNNVGTALQLLTTVLEGTGWEPGIVEEFLEKNGDVKMRSLRAPAKTGAFKLVTMICDLFEAKPRFRSDVEVVEDGVTVHKRFVDILPMNPFSHPADGDVYHAVETYANGDVLELHYGTNVSNVTRTYNTENLVTKLYAYGSYGDDVNKYCGIDECTHTEHRFTVTTGLSRGVKYTFTVNDDVNVEISRSFTPIEDVQVGNVLIWSCLDPASMMYVWDVDFNRAYRVTDESDGTNLRLYCDYERDESVTNMFSFVMDFTYYNDNGLVSDDMLQKIAKLQMEGKDFLEKINAAATSYSDLWQKLSEEIGIINFVKLDVDTYSTRSIDGTSYMELLLTDARIQYRTDYDAKKFFKWRVATQLKPNGDPVNTEAAVIYVIHPTIMNGNESLLLNEYDKYYIKEIDNLDDPSVLTLWANPDSITSNDICYLFEYNGVSGSLAALEAKAEAIIESADTSTGTVEHPLYFIRQGTTKPSIPEAWNGANPGVTVPSWYAYDNSYAWLYEYKYIGSTPGQLYFCHYTGGDRAWKKVYVGITQPSIDNGQYWYNWTEGAVYKCSAGQWIKLDNADDKNMCKSFGMVYYNCRKRDRLFLGEYETYEIGEGNSAFEPGNWYIKNAYGDIMMFSSLIKARRFTYNTNQSNFITVTPYNNEISDDVIGIKFMRFDNVLYHKANVLDGISFEEGEIDESTGGDIIPETEPEYLAREREAEQQQQGESEQQEESDEQESVNNTYRSTRAEIYSNLMYDIIGIPASGSITLYFYDEKNRYIMPTVVLSTDPSVLTPPSARKVRISCTADNVSNIPAFVMHILDYDTAIILPNSKETYHELNDSVSNYGGKLNGILPIAHRVFANGGYADRIYNQTDGYIKKLQEKQDAYKEFETKATEVLGDIYREGYWQKNDYVDGDEQKLYDDALDTLKQIAKPETTYNITFIDRRCEDTTPIGDDLVRWPEFGADSAVHLIDPELTINCWAYADEVKKAYDKPWTSSITINTNLTTMAQHSFADVLTHIADVANSVKGKETLYDRMMYITNGTKMTTDKLEGAIDTAKNQIFGGSSTWYTDDKGNIVFESADGKAAMTLTGNGFAISNAKDKHGDWVWRTFGTGDGFTADEIVTGTLSAVLIEAGSITADKINSSVGETLDLSSNKGINMKVESLKRNIEGQIGDARSKITQTADKIRSEVSYLSDVSLSKTATITASDIKVGTFGDGVIVNPASSEVAELGELIDVTYRLRTDKLPVRAQDKFIFIKDETNPTVYYYKVATYDKYGNYVTQQPDWHTNDTSAGSEFDVTNDGFVVFTFKTSNPNDPAMLQTDWDATLIKDSYVDQVRKNLSSSIEQTAQSIRTEVNDVHSELVLTGSLTLSRSNIENGTFSNGFDIDPDTSDVAAKGQLIHSDVRLRTKKIPIKPDDIISYQQDANTSKCMYFKYAIYDIAGTYIDGADTMSSWDTSLGTTLKEYKAQTNGFIVYTFTQDPLNEVALSVSDYDCIITKKTYGDVNTEKLSSSLTQTATEIRTEVNKESIKHSNYITYSAADIEQGTIVETGDDIGKKVDSDYILRTKNLIPVKKNDIVTFTKSTEDSPKCVYCKCARYTDAKDPEFIAFATWGNDIAHDTYTSWATDDADNDKIVEYKAAANEYVMFLFAKDPNPSNTANSNKITPNDYDATLTKYDGEIYHISSRVTQNADKIGWAIDGDGVTTSFTMTPAALEYVGKNVNMKLNNGMQLTIDSIGQAIAGTIHYATRENAPANPTIGTVWVVTDENKVLRCTAVDPEVVWTDITTPELLAALQNAGTAKAIADSKIKTFVQSTRPDPTNHNGGAPFDIGDLWIDTAHNNALYRWNGTAWIDYTYYDARFDYLIDVNDQQVNTFFKPSTYEFTVDDNVAEDDLWYQTDTKIVKRYVKKEYDDGETHNPSYYYEWVDVQSSELTDVLSIASTAKAIADGKIKTYSQPNAPSVAAELDIGDLWIDTDDNNKLYRWNGSFWIDYSYYDTRFDYLIDVNDSEVDTFFKPSTYIFTANDGVVENDLWYQTDIKIVKRYVKKIYDDGETHDSPYYYEWETVPSSELTDVLSVASTAKAIADGKIKTYSQPDAPTGLTAIDVGDLWIDTNDHNKLYRWELRNGTYQWVDYCGTDPRLDYLLDPGDGLVVTHYGTTPPSDPAANDIWFNTSIRKAYRYTATHTEGHENDPEYDTYSWEEIPDSQLHNALALANTAKAIADGKIKTYTGNTQPTDGSLGDLWIDTAHNNELYRHSGTGWIKYCYADPRLDYLIDPDDGIITAHYGTTAPENPEADDLWFNTETRKLFKYTLVHYPAEGNTPAYDAYEWKEVPDSDLHNALALASTAKAIADGKIKTYAQTSPPTSTTDNTLDEGDLWIDTDDDNKLYRWDSLTSQWVLYRDGALTYLLDPVDGVTTTYYGSTTPGKPDVGDIWYDTGTGTIKRCTVAPNPNATPPVSAVWMDITSDALKAALDAVNAVDDGIATKIDGRIVTFAQPGPTGPTGASVGDLWIDTSTNLMYRWNNIQWVKIENGDVNTLKQQTNTLTNTLAGYTNLLENAQQWYHFTDKGLRQGNTNSKYTTFIDEKGFYIDMDEAHISSFTKEGLNTSGLTVGNLAVHQSATGGWIWTVV